MRYLPKSSAERQQMLRAIGLQKVDDLFQVIPEQFRLARPLNLPGPMSEPEIISYFKDRAAENSRGYTSFLGAGVYNHTRSVVPDALIQRGEFLTAYTPYQAEISQGTLQAIFEFQTLMCQLTGQEVANASMYDGSTALSEAVMMAVRLTGRQHALVARSVHPEYRQVLATYAKNQGQTVAELPFSASGQVDPNALRSAVTEQTAALCVQSPNFLGVIEQLPELAEIAHAQGALLVLCIAEGVSLGLLRAPVEADIVALEAQAFGIAPSFGGPSAGVLATKEKFVRQLPGRLAGQTIDRAGRRGFVLTLATREQHIRREKATSNICTNQALFALAATIHLCLLGQEGIREMAGQNVAKAQFALAQLEKLPGVQRAFTGPVFNECTVEFPRSVKMINQELLREKIIGPLPLGQFYPEQTKRGLLCVTETMPRAEIERMVQAVGQILSKPV
jgi:glycine dehydrogenase subunit 1